MTDDQRQALELKQAGFTRKQIADKMGKSERSVKQLLERARRWQEADPSIVNAAKVLGSDTPDVLSHGWKISKDENGNGYSLFFKNHLSGEQTSIADMVKAAIDDALGDNAPRFEPRPVDLSGEGLLIVDLADVHFQKLCVYSETGYTYDLDIARHRVIEGTKALLRNAKKNGFSRILFVMGNDILHTDNGKTTTSGTPQDTAGSMFQAYRAASAAYKAAIELCAEEAEVDLIHCMSNHDWRMGWALSQEVAAWFQHHPRVSSTEYNLSERHRKYYAYENNAFMLTHGDGIKTDEIVSAMQAEIPQILAVCKNRYVLLHHFHSKTKQRRGLDTFVSERDHTGFTTIKTGHLRGEGSHTEIEHVRSPSPPDGWHDRNGYVNRQAVECFLYHPHDGQKHRFTEWF